MNAVETALKIENELEQMNRGKKHGLVMCRLLSELNTNTTQAI